MLLFCFLFKKIKIISSLKEGDQFMIFEWGFLLISWYVIGELFEAHAISYPLPFVVEKCNSYGSISNSWDMLLSNVELEPNPQLLGKSR